MTRKPGTGIRAGRTFVCPHCEIRVQSGDIIARPPIGTGIGKWFHAACLDDILAARQALKYGCRSCRKPFPLSELGKTWTCPECRSTKSVWARKLIAEGGERVINVRHPARRLPPRTN